jgi:hypothetical protein
LINTRRWSYDNEDEEHNGRPKFKGEDEGDNEN